MDKKCPECGEKIIGRVDKKFCSDYCRNSYNNKINKDSKNLIRNINNRLRKNHFDFDNFTSIYTTKKGTIYYFVYDLGYLPLDNNLYMIVKRE